MDAQDTANLASPDGRTRESRLELPLQLVGVGRAVTVHDGDALHRAKTANDLADPPHGGADRSNALHRVHDAVLEGQDRLYVQERSKHRLRAADASAAAQVLQGVEREVDANSADG